MKGPLEEKDGGRMSKRVGIEEAIGSIQDGFSVAIGGNVLHRAPMALIRELVRQKKKRAEAHQNCRCP